jgi:hypothetical protein
VSGAAYPRYRVVTWLSNVSPYALIVAVSLVLLGCGTSADGPTLTWENNAQYSTIEIERAARVGDECQGWRPLATVPGNQSTYRDSHPLQGPACYRLRGCTTTSCSAFTQPSWKRASH